MRKNKKQQIAEEQLRRERTEKIAENIIASISKKKILQEIQDKSDEVDASKELEEWIEDIEAWEIYSLETEEYYDGWSGRYKYRQIPKKMTYDELVNILKNTDTMLGVLSKLYNGCSYNGYNESYRDRLWEDIEEIFYDIQYEVLEKYISVNCEDKDLRDDIRGEIFVILEDELYEIRRESTLRIDDYDYEKINWNRILQNLK